nr:retrovirus-related Pol polyprotein from transposon TNT 1-94 [Tanacetum cinerariifolium]
MAFVSSPSPNSTNEVPTVYGVSTASPQSSTTSTQVSTANLSDATVYAFLSNQSNRSQLVHEDIEQIHEDDIEEMNLKWQVALLSMRAKRTINIEETPPKAMVAIDGVGFDWSYMAKDEVPTNMALMVFSDSEIEPKNACKEIPNELKGSPDAPLVKDRVSDNKDCLVESLVVVEKKTVIPTDAKIEFIKAKQQEKPVRKLVKYAEMYRLQGPRGNQRNWNNLKSQQLGSKFAMYNKACFVCGSFEHVPRPINTVRLRSVNTARLNSAVVNAVRVNKIQVSDGLGPQKKLISLFYVQGHPEQISRNLMEDMLHLEEEQMVAELLVNELFTLNRALVVKPHNKTPYELFRGRTPALSFMKPFGCHVTILNTLNHLGKFDGKANEGYFVGYSMNSKDFRVYNIRTRRVKENLYIEFMENKPIVVGVGPRWLFDIDMLTESMNYVPVIAGTNSNDFVGIEKHIGQNHSSKETGSSKDYILMPLGILKKFITEIENLVDKKVKLTLRLFDIALEKSRTSGLKRLYKVGLSARIVSSNKEGLGDQEGRMNDEDLFGLHDIDGDEVITDVTAGENVEQDATVVESIKVSSQQPSQPKDKGNAKIVEPKRPLKRKEQIMMDEHIARYLKPQMLADLEEEQRILKQKEEEANIAMIAEWDNTQAMKDADYVLAVKFQKEERDESYLLKRSQTMDSEPVKDRGVESSKRVGDEIEQESAKRQRLEKEDVLQS